MYSEYENYTLLTLDELCDELRIGKNAAYTLLNNGDIKAFRIGRVWKIPSFSINEFIINNANLHQATV